MVVRYVPMRKIMIALLLAASAVATADVLSERESMVYDTSGTKQEIAKRAQTCIAQLVRFDKFGESDTAAGQVITNVDFEGGVIVANSRIPIHSSFLGVDENVQSVLTILIRDGQFKFRHTAIKTAIANSGFLDKTQMRSPTARHAIKAIDSLNTSLSECINKPVGW
jgi:hypothetical protein